MADDSHPQPQLQPDTKPKTRVWLITSAFSALGYAVTREALKLGDRVVAGCKREEIELKRRAGAVENCSGGDDEAKSMRYLKSIGGDSCAIVELDVRYLVVHYPQHEDLLSHQAISCLGILRYVSLH